LGLYRRKVLEIHPQDDSIGAANDYDELDEDEDKDMNIGCRKRNNSFLNLG
jgi:hypothetical protein